MSLFKKKKNNDPAETTQMIRRVLSENFSDHKISYAKAIAGSLMISGATVFVGYIMRDVINDIFYRQRADLIAAISGSILLAFILRGLGSYIQAVQLAKIGNNLAAIYQKRIFAHLMKLGLNFYNDHRSGHLAAQINQNISGMRDLMNMTVTSLARDAVMLVGLLCIMVYQEPYLSLYSLLIAPPLILTVTYVSRRIRTVTREVVHLNSHLLGAMQETTQGIAIVKAFTMEDQLRNKINGLIERAEARSNKIASVSERVTPISEILAGIAIAAVIAYAGYRAIAEQQPPGTMFAFITSMMLAYDPARRLARLQVNLERALVNARMIYEILDLKPAQTDRPDAVELNIKDGTVRFEDVEFAYHAKDNPEYQQVLKGISFIAQAGETTAIVGASGAGKSTLITLIQRFYDVNSGRILIDDQDIAGVTVNSLRHSIAYVSQQPYLFEGSIADNIRYGRPDATQEEVIEAAKLANAHEFIIRQPQGYDSPVGENGVTLSGGQRQRLSIARAIVRNAPILLLDEATSALDNDSEKRVQQALETIMKDRTTIVIAHRLSTVVSADKIIVMEAGNIVEEGRHADLVAIENGVYARFYQLQSAPEAETLIG
ncbi:ABC transporter ATP-binding protein [Pseudochrobactrum sp. sp1633]|uniref:ABC transporter ATP-binding protein n=1 Tax=Pseudochrobactrum sp. sp1633 TaxID=3036706 RepID=UPI0025A53AAD|nr:ABC transporter ATP-binding protein [Pseudochrobactrum sp. sp1633]MDM8345937.1 ABC transporter ATP-binding protein [Pseudochrobactrum sp. sp1633]HWD12200.1 ABC transporter ATP-binding protein [Pseudochrobactrum sp.]